MSTSDDSTIDESAPGDASRRAAEDYEAAPGPELVVDFPDAGRRLGGIAQDVLNSPPDLPAPEETDAFDGDKGAPEMNLEGPQQFGRLVMPQLYSSTPALDVDVSITTPDGRSFSFREGKEYPDGGTADVTDILLMFELVASSVRARFEPLHLNTGEAGFRRTGRPIKDNPQA